MLVDSGATSTSRGFFIFVFVPAVVLDVAGLMAKGTYIVGPLGTVVGVVSHFLTESARRIGRGRCGDVVRDPINKGNPRIVSIWAFAFGDDI